jgi:hypothetical protein
MESEITLYNKRRWYQKYWYTPILVAITLIIATVPIYGYLTGYNIFDVGQSVLNTYTVGDGTFNLMIVGGYSTNEASNSLAQNIIPVFAVVAVILYALKSLILSEGITDYFWTLLAIVVGSVFVVIIVQILAQLT